MSVSLDYKAIEEEKKNSQTAETISENASFI